jgi:hypothetical protein
MSERRRDGLTVNRQCRSFVETDRNVLLPTNRPHRRGRLWDREGYGDLSTTRLLLLFGSHRSRLAAATA